MTCTWPCNPPTFTDGVESAAVSFNYLASGRSPIVRRLVSGRTPLLTGRRSRCLHLFDEQWFTDNDLYNERPDSTTILLTRSADGRRPQTALSIV